MLPTLLVALTLAATPLSHFVDEEAARTRYSGVILLARGDTVVLERAYGLADRTWRIPNRKDTVFPYCSITKPFTAALMLRALRERNLGVDTPIGGFFPQVAEGGWRQVTVRQLLTHTSGLANPDMFPEPGGVKSDPAEMAWFYRAATPEFATPASAAAYVLSQPPVGPPGTFRYNNGDYIVLGALLESLTHESFDDAVNTWVRGTLGLKGLRTLHTNDIVEQLATGYSDTGERPLRSAHARWENFGAAASLAGTAADLLAWTRLLTSSTPPLDAADVKALLTADPSTGFAGFGSFSYETPLGTRKVHLVERQGAVGSYRTLLLLIPEERVTAIFLSNSDTFENTQTYSRKGMPFTLLEHWLR